MSVLGGEPSLAADAIAPLRDWLDRFARCVREVDLDTGRSMVDADVVSFGSWTRAMNGLDELVEQQWRNVWPRTAEFRFDVGAAEGAITGDAAWIATTWQSVARPTEGKHGFRRSGRATFVFRCDRGRWIAVHTHYSLDPAGTL